jgi:HK97 family phage major capsid protein
MYVNLAELRAQRDQMRAALQIQLERRDGSQRLTRQETKAMDNLKELAARVKWAEAEERRGDISGLHSRINGGDPAGRPTMSTYSNVYRKFGRDSYVSDLVNHQLMRDDTGQCRRRLEAHAEEVQRNNYQQAEHRDLSRADGQGGYFSPPAWLVDEWIELARPGRAFANILSAHPLPPGVDVINVPKITSGSQTAIQVADNTQVQETDLEDSFVSSPVRTIAGQQSVSLQLIDQSPVNVDDVILQDLTAAHSVNLDTQCLYGTGSAGQLQGVNYTAGIGTLVVGGQTISDLYNALANGINQILTTRYRPPTHIVMHPRRWAYLLTLLDDQSRPLFVPTTNNPFNAAGVQTAVESEGIVGTVLGLPVVVDANIATTEGTEYSSYGDEDQILIVRAPDIVLYSSGVRARVLPEPLAQTLTVLVQLYSYQAICVRFPQSILSITGLTAPSFT